MTRTRHHPRSSHHVARRWRSALGVAVTAVLVTSAAWAGSRADAPHIAFDDAVTWHEWQAGKALAEKTGQPICVLLYANWCPRCRELAPLFAQRDIAALTGGVVMVKQLSDQVPPDLQAAVQRFGNYVPRMFFVMPDGSVRTEFVSGHKRFPYFYFAKRPEQLRGALSVAALDRWLGGLTPGLFAPDAVVTSGAPGAP